MICPSPHVVHIKESRRKTAGTHVTACGGQVNTKIPHQEAIQHIGVKAAVCAYKATGITYHASVVGVADITGNDPYAAPEKPLFKR